MNDELEELYQQVILDHSKRPRNFGELPGAVSVHGDNLLAIVAKFSGGGAGAAGNQDYVDNGSWDQQPAQDTSWSDNSGGGGWDSGGGGSSDDSF